MPTNGFSIKPLKVKLLAGEQKATEETLEPLHPLKGHRIPGKAANMLSHLDQRSLEGSQKEAFETRGLVPPWCPMSAGHEKSVGNEILGIPG